MPTNTENTKRIAKNTLMLYGRMLFSMVVSLYTSRVILAALGAVDYGINDVVGGLVGMFSILSGSLSAAVSRFLTFELGKNDQQKLKKTFSTSLMIHVALSIVVVLLMETVGLWFLNTKMTIPAERLSAANIVFHASVIAFVFNLLSVPYNASIISHEKMGTFAFLGILQTLLNLANILFVAYGPGHFDKLVVFSILTVLMGISLQLIYVTYCRLHFEECRFKLTFDANCLKEIGAFAGWNFIGASAAVLREQGGSVILNLFYGPSANAARGVANSVNRAVSSFSGNFMTALNPQITKSYASGESDYMMSLITRGARFSFYLLLMLSLPLIVNADFILSIWLKEVPAHSVLFVQLILIFTLSESLSNPLITAMLATGNIKKYQIVVGGLQLLNVPISYILLHFGAFQEIIIVVAICLSQVCLFVRLIMLRSMIAIDIIRYIKDVYCNVIKVAILSSIFPFTVFYLFPTTSLYSIINCLICIGSTAGVVFLLGCSNTERTFILMKAKEIIHRAIK